MPHSGRRCPGDLNSFISLYRPSYLLQARYFSWLEQQLQAGAKISESEGADKLEYYRKYGDDSG
jgi:hypothetical protein